LALSVVQNDMESDSSSVVIVSSYSLPEVAT
jgi:hypothetical protein